MPERLTDEQVAEALEWADAWLSATYVSRGAQQFLLIARFMRQVSADLSAAKDIGKRVAGVDAALGRASVAEAKLSAIQDAVRRAVGEYVCPNCHSARTALSSLRAHLPEAGR